MFTSNFSLKTNDNNDLKEKIVIIKVIGIT